MANIRYNLNNFSGGEISPKFQGRTDIQQYFTGCKTLTNFNIKPGGSLGKRVGTQFIYDMGTVRGACIAHSDAETKEKFISLITSYVGGGNGRCRTFEIEQTPITIETISEDHNFDLAVYYDDKFERVTMFSTEIDEDVTWVVNKNKFPVALVQSTKCRSVGTSGDTLVVDAFAWNVGTTYSTGDLVNSTGDYYKSLVDSNVGNAPSSSPSEWEILARDGNNLFAELWALCLGGVFSSNKPKIPTNVIKYENRIVFTGIMGNTADLTSGQAGFASSAIQESTIFRVNEDRSTGDSDPYAFTIFDEQESLDWMVGKGNLFLEQAITNIELRT